MAENGERMERQRAALRSGLPCVRDVRTSEGMMIVARSGACLGAVLWLGVFGLAPRLAVSAPAADETAIRATWSELDAAWAARDAERITRVFAEDAMFVFLPSARRLDGRPAIRAHFDAQFPRQSAELRHVTEIRRVRRLAEGLAAVDAAVRVLRRDEGGEGDAVLRAFAVFAVMCRREDEWQLLEVRAFLLPDPP